ncbi:MAG: C25 family cysteine peptidase [Promethearchaeota archaeon]
MRKKLVFSITTSILLFSSIGLFSINSIGHTFGIEQYNNVKSSGIVEDFDLSLLPDINYSQLNDIWYNHDIEMIIITPDALFDAAVQPLADWKNAKGVKTVILNNWTLYPGAKDPDKIRSMIKDFYEKYHIRWVLLAGDAEEGLIPIKYTYNPDTLLYDVPNESIGNFTHKPTDFYYADLTGEWDEDGDGNYGESSVYNSNGVDEIDWTPEVYVGRLPASNVAELEAMIDKILEYEKNPSLGDWMNRMLLGGGISSFASGDITDEDEARLTDYIWENYVETEMNFTHLYRTTSSYDVNTDVDSSDNLTLLTSNNFDTYFDQGFSTAIFAGHGGSGTTLTSYITQGSGQQVIYDINDAQNTQNIGEYTLFYADACNSAPFDSEGPDNNIGEVLIKRSNSGAIGYVGSLRVTYYVQGDHDLEIANRANAKFFWEEFFENKKFQQGKALYDSKVTYMESDPFTRGSISMTDEFNRKNVLTYCLLGDPELDVYTNKPLSALNPFENMTIYEAQYVSVPILDNKGNPVPNARVHFKTADGKYCTVYADVNGVATFRTHHKAGETYNVTITGHNLVPSYFNFTTEPDDVLPEVSEFTYGNIQPSTLYDLLVDVTALDNRSGIESATIFFNGNYSLVSRNGILENSSFHQFNLGRQQPGTYEYILIVRDYMNNTMVYSQSLEITIPVPFVSYIAIGMIVIVVIVSASIVFVAKKNIKKCAINSRNITKLKNQKN